MELRLGNDEEQGPPVERRHIVADTIAGAAKAFAAPAIAQTMPDVRRPCVPSFPRLLDTIIRTSERACRRLAAKANFGTPSAHRRAFRDQQLPWFRVTENTYDSFVHAMQASEARR